jgi:polynucleotide 5'-kinase involved in rRNA processing
LRILFGCALVCGHYFDQNEIYHQVDSPFVVPSLHVESTKKLNIKNLSEFLKNSDEEDEDVLAISNSEKLKDFNLEEIGCVLCIKEVEIIENQVTNLGNSYYRPYKKSILFEPEMKNIFVTNKYSSRIVPEEWYDKAKTIMEEDCPIVFVTGESNSNFSFLSIFLCNYFLNKHSSVALIDANVKDVFFNLPFTINLSIVRSPIFNCLSSENLYTEKSFFFGNENPLNNLDYFSDLVVKCFLIYKEKFSKIPLFVNVPSWINGDGYDKIVSFFKSFSPNFIVNITSKLVDINVEAPLHTKFQDFKGFLTVNSYEAYLDQFQDSPSYRRKYQLIKYFSSFKSYSVPFSHINVGIFNKNIVPSEYFRALNGSLIALLVDYSQYEISNATSFLEKKEGDNHLITSESLVYQANRLPKFLEEIPYADSNLIGFAIISSVNTNDGVFNILSPLPFDIISFVNTFLMGDLHLPFEIYVSNLDPLSDVSPYISSGIIKGSTNTSLFKKGSSKRKMYGHIGFSKKNHNK